MTSPGYAKVPRLRCMLLPCTPLPRPSPVVTAVLSRSQWLILRYTLSLSSAIIVQVHTTGSGLNFWKTQIINLSCLDRDQYYPMVLKTRPCAIHIVFLSSLPLLPWQSQSPSGLCFFFSEHHCLLLCRLYLDSFLFSWFSPITPLSCYSVKVTFSIFIPKLQFIDHVWQGSQQFI